MANRNKIVITLLLIAGVIIIYSFYKDVDIWLKASAYSCLILGGLINLVFNRKK